jgi:hypothetical protein
VLSSPLLQLSAAAVFGFPALEFSEPLGRAMLIVGLGGQAAAAFLIRRIVNIRV